MYNQVVRSTIRNITYYFDLDNGFKFFTFSPQPNNNYAVMANLRLKESESEYMYISDNLATKEEADTFLTDFLRRANYAFR